MHAIRFMDILAPALALGFLGGWVFGMFLGILTWASLLLGV